MYIFSLKDGPRSQPFLPACFPRKCPAFSQCSRCGPPWGVGGLGEELGVPQARTGALTVCPSLVTSLNLQTMAGACQASGFSEPCVLSRAWCCLHRKQTTQHCPWRAQHLPECAVGAQLTLFLPVSAHSSQCAQSWSGYMSFTLSERMGTPRRPAPRLLIFAPQACPG